MLETLTDLAHEKSSDKRRELLGRVADMFFDGAEYHTQQEAVIFRDIVLKMLDDVDVEGRAEFSAKVAPQDTLPSDVARQLAQDDVDVAGPMLQHSPVLTDEDFVEFSQKLSPEHLVNIAQREHLTGVVTDALIENGTREVWHKVSQNQGAEITSQGFDKLVANSDGDQVLQASLSARPDITEDAAKNLLPLLPPEGKLRLAKLFEQNKEQAEALVDNAQRAVLAEKLAGRKGRIETKVLIADIREGKITLSEGLNILLDSNRTADLVLLLSEISEIAEAVVSNALYQAKEEPIAILCKSMGVSDEAFTKIVSIRSEKLQLPLSVAGRAVSTYKGLDKGSSQRAMRFVQMRKTLEQ